MTKVFLTEVFDQDGNLTKIIATDHQTGEELLDFLWDPRDEQNVGTRAMFREWIKIMLKRKDYVSIN